MRYFITLAYNGTRFAGWQRQPNGLSVQETIERAISAIWREPVELMGCGRTDAGVHARYYVAHFDAGAPPPSTFFPGINSVLPPEVAVYSLTPMPPGAHARFDATERAYEYHLSGRKDPFSRETAWFFPRYERLDLEAMTAVTRLLREYDAFFPFCKTHSDVRNYRCTVTQLEWQPHPEEHRLVLHVRANRFLRGMVRLIVGASLNAGLGKLGLEEIRAALEAQRPLRKSLSVPPQGLFLTDVRYPYPLPGG